MITAATTPPKFMAMATKKQAVKATPAVMNQPPMTVSTPVMRNTALSRLQARSANEVPMATIKVTKVVERGNLSEVPRAMSNEATTRVDRGTEHVVGGTVVDSVDGCLEAFVDKAVYAFGGVARYGAGYAVAPAHEAAGYFRGTEHFVAFGFARKSDFGFNYLAGFL